MKHQITLTFEEIARVITEIETGPLWDITIPDDAEFISDDNAETLAIRWDGEVVK